MLRKTPRVYAYHGTTKTCALNIEREGNFLSSERDGLWLGSGRYFFQDAPAHALRWAQEKAARDRDEPAVFIAELDITRCIDLTDRVYWPLIIAVWEEHNSGNPRSQLGLQEAFKNLSATERAMLGRNLLDCDVMNKAIQFLRDNLAPTGLSRTTVRASFIEEGPVYNNSWLWTGSCTMVSVLDPEAILQFEQVPIDELVQFTRLVPATKLPVGSIFSPVLDTKIEGVWKLVSHSSARNGTKVNSFGDSPSGLMIVSPGGYVSIHVHNPVMPHFASNIRIQGTPDENKMAVQGSITHYGRLECNDKEGTLTIRIGGSSYPNAINTESVRSVSLSGDELRCTTVTPTSSGAIVEQVWKRVK
jgi:hypothetical protein